MSYFTMNQKAHAHMEHLEKRGKPVKHKTLTRRLLRRQYNKDRAYEPGTLGCQHEGMPEISRTTRRERRSAEREKVKATS